MPETDGLPPAGPPERELTPLEAGGIKEAEQLLGSRLDQFLLVLPPVVPADEMGEAAFQELVRCIGGHLPGIFAAYDDWLRRKIAVLQDRVYCGDGCSNCCAHYVSSVSAYEILHLDQALRSRADQNLLLREAYQRHTLFATIGQGMKELDEDVALYEYLKRRRPCPLLDGAGRCSEYARRPMSCRMFWSLAPRQWCAGENTVAPENRNFLLELPLEIELKLARASGRFDVLEIPEQFFPGLLRANELFGRF